MTTDALIGEYRVLERLGAGGMGEVFRAVHCRLGRVVALKVLSPGAATAKERFFNEARIHAALRHPGIATLFEFIEDNGRCCLVMEYVDGALLSDGIASGALPAAQALEWFAPLVEAAGYLHRHGIVHRDIKASNVKLTAEGQVKLLDFGIAQSGGAPRLTQVGSIIGTLEYLSPEQLRGEAATPQSDIWALGVLLFEMTTGTLPFPASNVAALHQAVKRAAHLQPRRFNAQMPREIETIIKDCLQPKPANRYADCAALQSATREAMDSIAGDHAGARRDFSKTKAPIIAAGAALLALGVLLGALILSRPANKTPRVPAANGVVEIENGAAVEQVKIDVVGGQAEVFRGGKSIGTTPLVLNEKAGTLVSLTLRREGYREKDVSFTITNRKKNFSYLMEKT